MRLKETPTHCAQIEDEVDGKPWYYDILRYVNDHQYPEHAPENGKIILRRLAACFLLDGEILYKKGKDQAWCIIEEIHERICGMHANGHIMAGQVMRAGYYWLTLERDCIQYARKCHKCQIYFDKIHVPPTKLHVMAPPWSFSMWGMDIIGHPKSF